MGKNRAYNAQGKKIILLAIILLIPLLASFVSAIIYTQAHGKSFDSGSVYTGMYGEKITIGSTAITLRNITKVESVNALTAYLLDDSLVVLASANFSGTNSAPFNYNLVAETNYYVLADSVGSNYNGRRLVALGYPVANTYLSWVAGRDISTETNIWYNIVSIDIEVAAVASIEVALISPNDAVGLSSSIVSFNSNYTAVAMNVTNATLYIWNSSGIFNNTARVTGLTNLFNSSNINVSGFVLGNYHWNVWGCAANSTGSLCTFAINNRTFNWIPFSVDWQSFTSQVFETSYQKFYLNITTTPNILSVDSKLNYNGTLYAAQTSCSGNSCLIIKYLDIPLITSGETINKTIWWDLTVYDGTNSYQFNTTDNIMGQVVNRTHIEECNATYTTKALNFTFYDEKNLSRVGGIAVGATFSTWLGTGAVKRTSGFDKAATSNLSICIQPTTSTFFTDATIEYSYEDAVITYINKNYYMSNVSISSATQEIPLYLLDSTDSTSFIIHVQDQTLSPVKNALVYIQRYYPVDGTYKTVQIVKTDDNGETVGFYEVETVDYKHLIYLNGTLLLETNPQKVVGKTVPYTLTFTVGEALEYPTVPWEDITGLTKSLSFNETSNIVTFTYTDTTGQITISRLIVYKERMDNSSITIICNTTSTQASATLTCNVGAYEGSITAKAYLNENISDIINFVISTAKEILGNTGLIMGWFIILTAGFAFFWNPTAGLVGINAALWLVNLIGFISFSPIFLFAILAISIIAAIILNT